MNRKIPVPRKNNKKLNRWVVVLVMIILILIGLDVRTGCSHVRQGSYASSSWEIVWPVIVSTLIAVFGTLVTSYVFLKDAMDRTIDEKPYYGKIIERYRQERIDWLIIYSILFVGISGYLILFQKAAGQGSEKYYDLFLYLGIVVVVVLLLGSLLFLYQCINIDKSIYKSAGKALDELELDIRELWERQDQQWGGFIDSYAGQREKDLQTFLEVEESGTGAGRLFSESKFVVKFSEWEKFILSFLDRSFGFQTGQTVEQRIAIAADYIDKLHVIPPKTAYYAKLLNVSYGRITIRNQKTRWGSYSSKGNLNFNCLLMLTPDEVVDYVVVHELCHRIEMNHFKAFWNLVESVLPDYSIGSSS